MPIDFRSKLKESTLMSTTNVVDAEVEDAPFEVEPVKTSAGQLVKSAGGPMAAYNRITDLPDFVNKMGTALANSCMFGCANADQGRVFALAMVTEGLSPLAIKKRYHLIGGNLTMRADAMLAEFRMRGGEHEIVERTSEAAEVELRMGRKKYRERFTWEDAQKEKFPYAKKGELKDNWATPRGRKGMLWARVVSDAVRAFCPEVNAGVYTPEEMGGGAEDEAVDAEVVVAPTATAPVVKATPVAPAPAAVPAPAPAPEQAPFTPPPAGTVTELQTEREPIPKGDLPMVTVEQLKEMKRLKEELGLADATWRKLIEKFGATSAKQLAFTEADRVIGWLIKQQTKTPPSEMSAWAHGAAGGAGND
jgi:hypothetical protein